MERLQSTYENQVEFNLSESGVHPLTLGELVDDDGVARRAARGEPALHADQRHQPLRDAIAALYPGATADHVQVTNGGAEANYITTWNLVEPGDEVVMMVPNFMQTWGLARAFGATVKPWPLAAPDERAGLQGRWRVDVDALERLVSPRTKLIVDLQSEQPDRRAVRGGRSRSHRRHRRPARQLDPLRRDLSRRRARRPRNADDLGPLRSGDRHERAVEGVRAARAAHRLDRRAAVAHRVAVVVSRLHDDRAGRAERRAGAARARAGARARVCSRARAAS